MIDTSKILGKPSTYGGDAAQWREWRFGFETWWACLDAQAETLLENAVVCGHVIVPATSTPDVQELGRILYLVLAQSLKGRPLDLLKTVSKSNGFEAYRILIQEYEPKTKNRTLGMLQSIMSPLFGKDPTQFMIDLVKWENEIREYCGLSGKTFDDDLKVALVTERAPAEIKLHIQINSGAIADYDMLRELIRSYFQASEKYKQSTANPDRMDVGAIKGKFGKEEKGKSWNQYGKGKDDGKGKSWNQYGKSGKDDKGKGKFGKGKYKQGKDTKGGNKSGDVSMKGTYYKAPANSQFQGECSHCGKWGHKASECWRKQVAGVGEDGTGNELGASASAVGSTATKSCALVTDDQRVDGPWVFSIIDGDTSLYGMVMAVTEDIAEIVVDSGSVANVCPPEFGAEFGFTSDAVPKLFNVNYEALKCYGMRMVSILLKCDDGTWLQAMILFVVANVAYPVLSVGKMIANGYTGVFAPSGSFIAKNGRRVQVQTRGKTFILEGKLGTTTGQKQKINGEHVVAPVVGLGPGRPRGDPDDEMITDQDIADFRAAVSKARVDEATRRTQLPPASSDGTGLPAAAMEEMKPPGEVQKIPLRPSPAEVKRHELLHLPYASWCETCISAKGKNNKHPAMASSTLEVETPMPKVQLDLMFMSAVGEFVDEANAKSTVLTVVSRECGTIGTTELKSKDHIYAWAFVKQFLDVLGYDEVELKSDNEPTTKFICEQVE